MRHRREDARIRRPQHGEHEDQPDVVGLPHRGDRVVSWSRICTTAVRARRSAARSRRRSRRRPAPCRGQPDQHEQQRQQRHGTPTSSPTSAGPPGTAARASRRRIHPRRRRAERRPATSTPYPTGMPEAPVTASLGAHDAVDDPGLAPDLGRDPAGDQRDHRGGPASTTRAVEPRRERQPAARDSGREEDRASSASSQPIPTIVWNANRTTLTGGRSSAGTVSARGRSRSGCAWPAATAAAGSPSPKCTSPSLYQPPHVHRRARRGRARAPPARRA